MRRCGLRRCSYFYRPIKGTGVGTRVVFPSAVFPPGQQTTKPSVFRAQVGLEKPPLTLMATVVPAPKPITEIGVYLKKIVPSPNWPWLFSPQQTTEPSFFRAQV